jgi:NADPH:quinone reductase-like Zn-dependent oxidoreductase
MPVTPLTMRAVIQDGYGAPERVLRLEEIPVPPVGADDVLIRMSSTAASVRDASNKREGSYTVNLTDPPTLVRTQHLPHV